MKLYPIFASGITAYGSDVITDPFKFDTIYFLAVCGYQATVKGIIANLLENRGISINLDGMEHYLERSDLGYKVLLKKLPSGFGQAILFPQLALPKNDETQENHFYFFTRTNEQDRFGLFFRHLDEKTDLPLHRTWQGWLWRLFEKQNWLVELKTLAGNFKGYAVRFNPKHLHDLVSEAIRNNDPEIAQCWLKKGGTNDGKINLS